MTDNQILDVVKIAYKAIDDKLGTDIVVMKIVEVTPVADYFIIATANNRTQLQAICDEVGEKISKQGLLKLKHIEGYGTSEWVLMDFGDIVVHLFLKDAREFYNLERIWKDAPIVSIE